MLAERPRPPARDGRGVRAHLLRRRAAQRAGRRPGAGSHPRRRQTTSSAASRTRPISSGRSGPATTTSNCSRATTGCGSASTARASGQDPHQPAAARLRAHALPRGSEIAVASRLELAARLRRPRAVSRKKTTTTRWPTDRRCVSGSRSPAGGRATRAASILRADAPAGRTLPAGARRRRVMSHAARSARGSDQGCRLPRRRSAQPARAAGAQAAKRLDAVAATR